MALTTETTRRMSDLTQADSQRQTSEAAILFDKSIVAKPLNAPEVASIHVKNTEYYYRWVNRLHGNGSRYMAHKAMGFTNATSDDVEVLVGDVISNTEELRSGDVILMKIPFHLWAQHAKRNMQTAEVLQRMRGVHNREDDLSPDVFSDEKRSGRVSVTSELKGKVAPFIPTDPDAIIDGQKASDAEKARATVADIRKRHASERDGK